MTTVQVILTDGTAITVTMEHYDAVELTAKLNNPQIRMITIGNIIINVNAVKMVGPVAPNPPIEG